MPMRIGLHGPYEMKDCIELKKLKCGQLFKPSAPPIPYLSIFFDDKIQQFSHSHRCPLCSRWLKKQSKSTATIPHR